MPQGPKSTCVVVIKKPGSARRTATTRQYSSLLVEYTGTGRFFLARRIQMKFLTLLPSLKLRLVFRLLGHGMKDAAHFFRSHCGRWVEGGNVADVLDLGLTVRWIDWLIGGSNY